MSSMRKANLVRWNVQGLSDHDHVWVGQLIIVQDKQATPVLYAQAVSNLCQGIAGLHGVVLTRVGNLDIEHWCLWSCFDMLARVWLSNLLGAGGALQRLRWGSLLGALLWSGLLSALLLRSSLLRR